MTESNQNKTQNNNMLWLGIGLAGGAIIVYWWMKHELDKQKKELETHLNQANSRINSSPIRKRTRVKENSRIRTTIN